jgi:tetratricopeptide (TPR) repeat protein
MEGSKHRGLKSLKKQRTPLVLGFGMVLISACASSGSHRRQATNDAVSKIEGQAQADWERSVPGNGAEYHFVQGQALSQDGMVEAAIEEYRAALVHDPDSALIHARLAAEYLKKGSNSLALEECERSVKLDPKAVDVRLMLAGIHAVNHQLDRALREYDQVLKIDPLNDEAAVFKAQVLGEQERYGEALHFLRGFTKKVSDSAAVWFFVGKLEYLEGRPDAAVRAYRKALEIRSGFAQASFALGVLLETRGAVKKAIEVYEVQLEDRFDLPVAGRLVTLYLKANLPLAAMRVLQSMAAVDPEDLNTRLRIGLLHMQRENWSEAKKALTELSAKVPDSDKVHYYLSAVHEQEKDFERTLFHLLKVSKDSKLFEDSRLHAAGIFRRLGSSQRAHEVIAEALKMAPENPGFYIAQAGMFEDEKKIEEAAMALHAGLKVFPEHEKMRYFRGALLEKLGKVDESVQEMQRLLQINPEHADALNFVAYTWTTQGVRLRDAEAMLKRALRIKPNNPYILDSLGWNQFMLGQHKHALVYLEKAVFLKGDEETILEHLVEVYARNQMPERARALRARIADLQTRGSRSPASIEVK